MESYRSERTLNLKHFLIKLITKWYWVAAAFAAGAIGAPVLQFLQLIKTYRKELAAFEEGVKNAKEPTFPSFPFTHIFVGAVIGFVLAVLVIGFIYYLDNRLKCSAELNKPRDTELFAVYKVSKDTKTEVFAKKLLRYPVPLPVQKMTSLLCARVYTVCKNQEINTIVVAGSVSETEKVILMEAVEKLRKAGLSVEWIGNVLSEPEAILGMKAGVGVILAERTGKTTYSTLDEEIAICTRNRMRLLGFTAFE